MVNANGTMFTFVASVGMTLPVLATVTFVEVRGLRQNGTISRTTTAATAGAAQAAATDGSGIGSMRRAAEDAAHLTSKRFG